ncbi:MAG: hypothetical protein RQ729_01795 [Wenzhouxiangellaceae bacterium]|nr:hypothetical protein [Wenzhouxiangellaceae bacterium]
MLTGHAAADELRNAAEDAVQCRELRDTAVRLACLDAAVARLADTLKADAKVAGTARQSSRSSRAQLAPVVAAPEQAKAPVPTDLASAEPAVEGNQQTEEDVPTWATAPAPRPARAEREADPKRFNATIVRITRNGAGRHTFYTDDGAVWEQTQIEEIRAPASLPAVAEFRRRLTGNPTIKFDVSNRAYRVRRIE